MCNEIPSQLAMKIYGNIDECNISKPNLRHTYYICDEYSWQIATKFRRYSNDCGKIVKFFQQTCIDIATMNLGFKKINYMKYGIPYCMPYYNVIW